MVLLFIVYPEVVESSIKGFSLGFYDKEKVFFGAFGIGKRNV